jgi:hypothetical protein
MKRYAAALVEPRWFSPSVLGYQLYQSTSCVFLQKQAKKTYLFLDRIVSPNQSCPGMKVWKMLPSVLVVLYRQACLQYTCAASSSHPPSPNDR